MEITCPSCGVKHRTEDHPNAFEILCVCGYSILVPDVAAFNAPPVTASPRGGPLSLDAEDAAMAVTPAKPTLGESAFPEASQMTPPENLPEGMVYDPFELPQQSVAATGFENPPEISEPSAPEFSSAEEAMESSESPESPGPAPAAPSAPPPDPASAQALVERVQAASMGRLLGHSFALRCEGLERDALVEVARRCVKLIKQRPWLDNEMRARKLDLEALPDAPELSNVPEILALEIYLACYEAGGSCVLKEMG